MSTLIEEQYIKKAKEAFEENSLKLCLVYLKKVTTWSTDLITLLVESAYRLWKNNVADDNGEENETIEIVRQAFTQLLSGTVPFHLIQAYDYIRLSHIYLAEGNLHGALEIVNLASSRGHLEDVLIVTQTWTIIKRIDGIKKREITDRINFLVTAVTLLAGTTKTRGLNEVIYIDNSPMPLSYVYLHCTNHLYNLTKQRPKSVLQKNQRLQQYHAMLIESYYLSYGIKETNLELISNWFLDPETWYTMGKQLEDTPFICFIEDCYWEAYLRRPLDNKAIETQVNSMIKYKREKAIPFLLREAIMFMPWNVYSRKTLITYEEKAQSDPTLREWTNLFQSEILELSKIQAHVRGWYLRRHWENEISIYWKELRAEFLRKMVLSYEYYDNAVLRYHQSLLKKWKIYIMNWKELKYKSSCLIQTNYRRHYCQVQYSYELQRMQYANSQYLSLLYLIRKQYRMNTLHHWYHIYNERKKNKAADIITAIFFLNGYNQLLVKGMTLITTLLRIHRYHERKRVFQYWLFRYHHRRKIRAMNTIRFFIRFIIRRQQDQKIENELKAIESIIAEKLQVEYERNRSYIVKPYWQQWRKAYLFLLRYRKVLTSISTIQRKFYQRKAIKRVHELWLRKENQFWYEKSRNHHRLVMIIHAWRINAASFRISRFFHNRIAYKKYKKLYNLSKQILEIKLKRELKIKERIWWRIEKYRFLYRRERLRAIKKLQQFCKYVLFKKHLRKLMKRKSFYYLLIWKLHYYFSRLMFHRFRYRIIYKQRYRAIAKFDTIFTSYLLLNGFRRLQSQVYHQEMIRKLIEHRFVKKWKKQFFPQAYRSVRVLKGVSFTNMHEYQEKQQSNLMKSISQEEEKEGGKRSSFDNNDDNETHDNNYYYNNPQRSSSSLSLSTTSPFTRSYSLPSSPVMSPSKIITSRAMQRSLSPSSSPITLRRVPSPSNQISPTTNQQHYQHNHSHIDIFKTTLAPWEEYTDLNKKVLYSIQLMKIMKYFHYWIIQYRLKTRQVRLQSLLFSYQFQDFIFYRLFKHKQFIITLQSFFRQMKARKRFEYYRTLHYKATEIAMKHHQIKKCYYWKEIIKLCNQRQKSRIKLQCWIRYQLAQIEYQQYQSKQEQYNNAIKTIQSSYFYRNTIIREYFQCFVKAFVASFMKNISNDHYIIHKDQIRKEYQRKKKKTQKQQRFLQKKSSNYPSKFSKKLRKSVREGEGDDEDDDSLRYSDEDEYEEEDQIDYVSNHYDNDDEDDDDDEDMATQRLMNEFDSQTDASLLRLEMIEKYQNKLNQRQLTQLKITGKDILSPLSPTLTATSTSTAAHVSQIKQLQREKQKQLKQQEQSYERKKTIHTIKERKLQLQQKFTSKQSLLNKPMKPLSFHSSQTMIYFQSQSFHTIYHTFYQSRFLTLDDRIIESLYPQEIYYLLQQTNRILISDITSKKQLSYLSESFNGKYIYLMNGRLHESYYDKYIVDLLFTRKRLLYGKIPFETNRWPLTLPLYMIEDEEEAEAEKESSAKVMMDEGGSNNSGEILDLMLKKKEEMKKRKRKLISLSIQSLTMSIYTIMKFCRHMIRMKQNDEMLFTLTSSRLIIQDLEIEEKGKDIEKAKEKEEDDDIEEVMLHKDVRSSKHSLYRKVIYIGLQDLTIDIASFGWLGYLLLLHSLQVRYTLPSSMYSLTFGVVYSIVTVFVSS